MALQCHDGGPWVGRFRRIAQETVHCQFWKNDLPPIFGCAGGLSPASPFIPSGIGIEDEQIFGVMNQEVIPNVVPVATAIWDAMQIAHKSACFLNAGDAV